MPDRRSHRGAHPEDRRLFGVEQLGRLKHAVADVSMLLGMGYSDKAVLKLVGDHLSLDARQRVAVMRASCSAYAAEDRRGREIPMKELRGRQLALDGYNVLTTVEAALGGGVILSCRDGCYRDMASVHGTYRRVEETVPALELVGRTLVEAAVSECRWYLDSPVSNSGRLRAVIEKAAEAGGWAWTVELVMDPDPVLAECGDVVATADSVVLGGCGRWCNLARAVVEQMVPQAWLVDMTGDRGEGEPWTGGDRLSAT